MGEASHTGPQATQSAATQAGTALRVVARQEAPVRLQRSEGHARVAFKRRAGATVLADLYQSGCSKVRLPAHPDGHDAEAALEELVALVSRGFTEL